MDARRRRITRHHHRAGADRRGVGRIPDALEFDGNHTFPSSELREALAVSADYLLAAHPFAPLSAYPASVRAALLRGYRNEGFPDAAITVTPDVARNKVRVQITEGPRFLAGDLSVEGVQAAPAAELVRALTEAHPGAADPIFAAEETVLADQRTAQNIPAEDDNPDRYFWEHGKPVDFDDDFAGSAEARTRRELAARGYPLAEVKAVLRRDNAARVAHLVLHVQEGRGARGHRGDPGNRPLKGPVTPERICSPVPGWCRARS